MPFELLRRGSARGTSAIRGETRLELIGQCGVLHPHSILHLLKRHVGVECGAAGRSGLSLPRQHVRGIELAPNPGEHHRGGIRGCHRALKAPDRGDVRAGRWRLRIGLGIQGRGDLSVGHPAGRGELAEGDRYLAPRSGQPEQGRVHRRRPTVIGGEPSLEGGHRGAGDADGYPAIEIERGTVAERVTVGEVGRLRIERRAGGAVSPSGHAVAAGTIGLIQLGAAREGRNLGGNFVERHAEFLAERRR